MQRYQVLSEGFDEVKIDSYDPTIWSPREVLGRDEGEYEVEEPESEKVSEDIIEKVREVREETSKTGSEFYNGPLIRLRNHELSDKTLELDIQNTNYFSHVGTRDRPELGKGNRADPLSVGAYLRTADDHIVLGERSGLVELGEEEYQLPGAGFIEDPELQYERSLNAQTPSPIHRELEEEVNLASGDITTPQPSALIGAVHRQPMLVYLADTVLDAEELVEGWTEIPEPEREFSELIFLPENNLEEALEGEKDVLASGKEETVRKERFTGELRPHAEGTLEAFN
jgi:hypothetical protein